MTGLRRAREEEIVYCELCGQPIQGERYYVELEGAELVVCARCYRRYTERARAVPEPARLRGLGSTVTTPPVSPGVAPSRRPTSTATTAPSPAPRQTRQAATGPGVVRRGQPQPRRRTGTTRLDVLERYEVVPNYAEIVRRARERLGWTHRILAEKVKESERVIRRIEAGELVPTIDLARRLERVLGVKLLEPVIDVEEGASGGRRDRFYLTLGDIAELRED